MEFDTEVGSTSQPEPTDHPRCIVSKYLCRSSINLCISMPRFTSLELCSRIATFYGLGGEVKDPEVYCDWVEECGNQREFTIRTSFTYQTVPDRKRCLDDRRHFDISILAGDPLYRLLVAFDLIDQRINTLVVPCPLHRMQSRGHIAAGVDRL